MAKRNRSSNFTNDEKLLALNIISNHLHVIENKATRTVTWREKETAWDIISDEFNSQSPNKIFRSKDSLKNFFENKKRETRKICAEEKKELYTTGGGTPTTIKYDPTVELAKSMMNKKTIEGLTNTFDADRLPVTNDVIIEYINESEIDAVDGQNIANIEIEEVTLPHNWGDYKVKNLQIPVSKELKDNLKKNATPSTSQQWQNRRRPKTDLAPSHISKQYSDLAEIKLELAKLELQILKDTYEIRTKREEEEHAFKMMAIKLDIKIKEKTLEKIISKI